jgi:type IV secretion system protein VirB11
VSLAPADWTYFAAYLQPLEPFLRHPDVTDLYVNRPGEIWIERIGGRCERHDAPALTEAYLWRLARQIAAFSHQGISREHPLLSASLPGGERVQIVAPPATRASLVLAIRKHVSAHLRLADYADRGAFASTHVGTLERRATGPADGAMPPGDALSLLRRAVIGRKNILVSGGTSSGKTTFLNALLGEVPAEERLILIEDTPELRLQHANAIGLLAVKGLLGEARVSADDLLQASLRLRPDRIIVGELRGSEAYTFLRAVNTGHPGSMTSIHADSPDRAVEQLALIIAQSGTRLGREDVIGYVRGVIDVYVQLGRTGGRRSIEQVILARA